jgi:hypothetical protein
MRTDPFSPHNETFHFSVRKRMGCENQRLESGDNAGGRRSTGNPCNGRFCFFWSLLEMRGRKKGLAEKRICRRGQQERYVVIVIKAVLIGENGQTGKVYCIDEKVTAIEHDNVRNYFMKTNNQATGGSADPTHEEWD